MLLKYHVPILCGEYQVVVAKLRQETVARVDDGEQRVQNTTGQPHAAHAHHARHAPLRTLFCFREPGLVLDVMQLRTPLELRKEVQMLTGAALNIKDRLRTFSSSCKGEVSFQLIEIMTPLLDIIKSPAMSATVTGEALAVVYRVITEMGVLDGMPLESSTEIIAVILETVVQCIFRQTESGDDEIAIMWALELLDACTRNVSIVDCLTEELLEHALVTVFKNCVASSNADMLRRLAAQKLAKMIANLFSFHFLRRRESGEKSSEHDLVAKVFQFLCRRVDINSSNFVDMESRQTCLELLFTAIISTICPKDGSVLLDFHPKIHEMMCDDLFRALLQICQLAGHPVDDHFFAAPLSDGSDLVKVVTLPSLSSDHVSLGPPAPPPPPSPPRKSSLGSKSDQGESASNVSPPQPNNAIQPKPLRNILGLLPTTFTSLERQYANLSRTGNGHVGSPDRFDQVQQPNSPGSPGSRVVDHLRLPLTVLSRALRIVHTLIGHENTRTHLKVQIEAFFNSVFLRSLESKTKHTDSEARRMVLETLTDLIADPSIAIDLFINYDCSLDYTNVNENLFIYLSNHSFPKQLRKLALDPLQLLSLRCIHSGVKAIAARSGKDLDGILETIPPSVATSEELLARKRAKRQLLRCALEFNRKPKAGIQALTEAGVISNPPDPKAVAKFLRSTRGLEKAAIGEFLGTRGDLNAEVLQAFVSTFDMNGMPLLSALRMFLESFRLPGEAQMIDRILQCFAEAAHLTAVDAQKFPTVDCTYLLCFSIILLNTDLHNPNIRPEKKMSFDAFKINNLNYGAEVSKGQDMPLELLREIYDEIKNREINTMSEGSLLTAEVTTDRWRDIIHANTDMSIISAGYPDGANEFQIKALLRTYDRHVFSTIHKPAIAALSVVYGSGDPSKQPRAVEMALEGLKFCADIACHFNMVRILDAITVDICKFTSLILYGYSHPVVDMTSDDDGDSLLSSDDEEFASGVEIDEEEDNLTDCDDDDYAVSQNGGTSKGKRGKTLNEQGQGGDSQPISPTSSSSIAGSLGRKSSSRENGPDVLGSSQSIVKAIQTLETSLKAQSATSAVFEIAHHYGDSVRLAWPLVLYCLLRLFDLDMLPSKLLTESLDETLVDGSARVQFHNKISAVWKKDMDKKLHAARENLERSKGWVSWLSGESRVEAEQLLSECEDEHSKMTRAIGFVSRSLEFQRPGCEPEKIHTPKVIDRIKLDHLATLVQDTVRYPDTTLVAFVRGLILACSGEENQGFTEDSLMKDVQEDYFADDSAGQEDIRPDITIAMLSPSSRAARVFGIHLLTEVTLANIHRSGLVWQLVRSHFVRTLKSAKTTSSLVEKAGVGLLRISTKLFVEKQFQFGDEVVSSIKLLLRYPSELAPGLSSLVGGAVVKIMDIQDLLWTPHTVKILGLLAQSSDPGVAGFGAKKLLPKICSHESLLDIPSADIVSLFQAYFSRAAQNQVVLVQQGRSNPKVKADSEQELVDLLDLMFIFHSRLCQSHQHRADWFSDDLRVLDVFFSIALKIQYESMPSMVCSHANKLLQAAIDELSDDDLAKLRQLRAERFAQLEAAYPVSKRKLSVSSGSGLAPPVNHEVSAQPKSFNSEPQSSSDAVIADDDDVSVNSNHDSYTYEPPVVPEFKAVAASVSKSETKVGEEDSGFDKPKQDDSEEEESLR